MRRSRVLSSCFRSMSISLALVFLGFASCTTVELEEFAAEDTRQLAEVTVSLTGIDFTLNPATILGDPSPVITRASDATPAQAGITRIALKVFDKDGVAVADTSQIAAAVGEGFNNLRVQLPVGTYTFVAVAHDATAEDVGCATITSAEVATLPEAVIPTLYSTVKEVEIGAVNSQPVTIDMGKRINATLSLASTDIVPEGVTRMAIDINTSGITLSASKLPQINPSTGFSVANYRFARRLAVEVGKTIDLSMNLLLPADEYSLPLDIHAQDATNKTFADYDRSFTAVPFQRAYVTKASG